MPATNLEPTPPPGFKSPVTHWVIFSLDCSNPMGYIRPMQTLRHTMSFERASKILSEEELQWVLETIARNPTIGVLIPGTGGVRKLRVAMAGRGKSGGARVVYFYFDPHCPIYLLYAYAKNERSDLTAAERKSLATLTTALKEEARRLRR